MITKAQWRERQNQWLEYHRWADTAPMVEHPAERVLADVGTVLEWIRESRPKDDPDPERLGVRRMHWLLGLLKVQ